MLAKGRIDLFFIEFAVNDDQDAGHTHRNCIRGLEGINIIAADIVEVAPAYDTNAEHTTMAAADALYEVMSLMVKKGPLSKMIESEEVDKDEM